MGVTVEQQGVRKTKWLNEINQKKSTQSCHSFSAAEKNQCLLAEDGGDKQQKLFIGKMREEERGREQGTGIAGLKSYLRKGAKIEVIVAYLGIVGSFIGEVGQSIPNLLVFLKVIDIFCQILHKGILILNQNAFGIRVAE